MTKTKVRGFLKKANGITFFALDSLYVTRQTSYVVITNPDIIDDEELVGETLWADLHESDSGSGISNLTKETVF